MNTLWLCWNNFVYLLLAPWMYYVSLLRVDIEIEDWSWELKSTIALTVASVFNHMCSSPDVNVCVGGLDQQTLVIFDIYWALMMLSSVVSIQLNENMRRIWLPTMSMITMCLCLVFPNGNVPMIVIFSLATLTYFYYRITPLILHPRKHWTAVLGLIVFGVAILFKQHFGNYELDTDENINNYSLYHGIWHILSAFGAALVIWDSRHAPGYYE